MKKYRVFDIEWDLDYCTPEQLELPNSTIVELSKKADPVYNVADALSGKFGWCVAECRFEEIK